MKGITGLRLIGAVLTLALLAACSSTPPKAEAPAPAPVAAAAPPAPPPAPVAKAPPPPPPAAPAPVAQAKPPLPEYLDPNSPLHQHHQVYFAFDTSVVGADYNGMLDNHAAFLSKHQDVHVTVEGNCDERGSAEYNLALGQRRADAVAKALTARGVQSSQLDTRSWGKEKPVADGHDETAWAQNRRADLVYPDH